MIRTYVTPETNQLQLSIPIPEGYVGEKLEVLVKKSEEAIREGDEPLKKGNIAGFRGALKMSNERYEEYQQFLKQIRSEWDRAR